jgi:hypothetical protein
MAEGFVGIEYGFGGDRYWFVVGRLDGQSSSRSYSIASRDGCTVWFVIKIQEVIGTFW